MTMRIITTGVCLAASAWIATAMPPAARGSEADRALGRAAAWLWAQQADDGGWHSAHYGLLKSGQAYTPLILHTLMQVPEALCPRPIHGIERALAFIRRHVDDRGALGRADPDVLEYPNYATAYAVRCLVAHATAGDRPLIERMTAYLLTEQYGAGDDLSPGHGAYGAWGFGGDRAEGVGIGHLDIAHTRRVLDALDDAGGAGTAALQRAQAFLRVVQRVPPGRCGTVPPTPGKRGQPFDGGFYFSPVVLAANKGRQSDAGGRHYRSYATATCDGLLALLAAGVDPCDHRIRAAAEWLADHPRWDYPAGIPLDHPEPWGAALFYYHLAVRAEVHAHIGWTSAARCGLLETLLPEQTADGCFVNTRSHLMKEDDPLLATTLGTVALTAVLATGGAY